MGNFKITISIHSANASTALDAVQTDSNYFDFSKIHALPIGHEKIHDLQNHEAIYYFLTNRMTTPMAAFEYKMYFQCCMIPELKAPSLPELMMYTNNYLSKFKADGSFDTEQNAGFYPFPHNSLDELFECGRVLVSLIDQYNINNLSYWKCQHWGSYLNASASQRITDNTVSFDTTSIKATKIVRRFIKKYNLSCKVDIFNTIDKVIVNELIFTDGQQVYLDNIVQRQQGTVARV